MIYKKLLIVLIISVAFSPYELNGQKWKKSLKNIRKDVVKKVDDVKKDIVKEVKPLTVDFKVSKVKYNPLKAVNKLILTIDFDCENPNPVGVTFNRTEFDLFVNDKLISKFYNEKKISVPKQDKFFFQETAEINIIEAGKTLFSAMIKKSAVYTLVGKYFIDTPIGPYSFKVKLLEKEMNKSESSSSKKSKEVVKDK